jgi:hypothetical protein
MLFAMLGTMLAAADGPSVEAVERDQAWSPSASKSLRGSTSDWASSRPRLFT